jgi:hypothetical protein
MRHVAWPSSEGTFKLPIYPFQTLLNPPYPDSTVDFNLSTTSGAPDCLRGDACEDLPLPGPRCIAEVGVAPGVVRNQELRTHIRVIGIGHGEFAEGVMVPQAEEFAQVDIGHCGISADHEHVFVIVAC